MNIVRQPDRRRSATSALVRMISLHHRRCNSSRSLFRCLFSRSLVEQGMMIDVAYFTGIPLFVNDFRIVCVCATSHIQQDYVLPWCRTRRRDRNQCLSVLFDGLFQRVK